jgi:hypothetical protein
LPPLALATTEVLYRGFLPASRPRRLAVIAVAWLALLVTLRGLTALVASPTNTGSVAEALERAGIEPSMKLVVVDAKENGLRFYGYRDLIAARYFDRDYPFFVRIPSLSTLAGEKRLPRARFALLADPGRSRKIATVLEEMDLDCQDRPAIYDFEFFECSPGAGSPRN